MSLDAESLHETSDLFDSKSFKLEKIINNALKDSEKLTIPEIISIYFHVIDTNSLIDVLRQHFDNCREVNSIQDSKNLITKINQIEKKIINLFDTNLHPTIMNQLTTEIEVLMNTLNAGKKISSDKKPNHIIQEEAKKYDRLRELLSTKEFTIQYDKGLKDKL